MSLFVFLCILDISITQEGVFLEIKTSPLIIRNLEDLLEH